MINHSVQHAKLIKDLLFPQEWAPQTETKVGIYNERAPKQDFLSDNNTQDA